MNHLPLAHVAGAARALLLLWGAAVLSHGAHAADATLDRLAPADTGLYVELQGADDLLIPLTESNVWMALAELAGQPAQLADVAEWRRRVHQTVQMSPLEAINQLFSRRVAFVGDGLGRAQDAAILCQPLTQPRQLVRHWRARPLPMSGRIAVFRLPTDVGVAVHQDLLIFGNSLGQGMFGRVLEQCERHGAACLANNDTYRQLLARVPPNPVGIFYARLDPPEPYAFPTLRPTTSPASAPATPSSTTPASTPATVAAAFPAPASAPGATAPLSEPASAPAALLPGPLRGSRHVLLALHRDGRCLQFTAVGDAPGTTTPRSGSLAELLARLPARTLVAWAGHVDYATLGQRAETLPPRNFLRVVYQLQEKAGLYDRVSQALSTATCCALGAVTPPERTMAAPPIPAVAVLITARDGAALTAEWDSLFRNSAALYNLLVLDAPGARPLPPVEDLSIDGARGASLDVGAALSWDLRATPLGALHLCWVLDGDVLILASHKDWLRDVVAARHGRTPDFAGLLTLSDVSRPEHPESVVAAQPGPLADLGQLWLSFFEGWAPQVLDSAWWQDYQPAGRLPRLGMEVRVVPADRRLIVESVAPNMPAAGLLAPGDAIVGVTRRRFATSQPLDELAQAMQERPNPRCLDVWVERDGVVRTRRLPLPFVDPVQLLRRVVAIGGIVQRVVYSDDIPDERGARGLLTVELRPERTPLFDFGAPTTQPTSTPSMESQPTSAPATESQPTSAPVSQPVIVPDSQPSTAPGTQSGSPPS